MNEELTDNQIKHLEFLQNSITRMGNNSFMLKGWMITLVTALTVAFITFQKHPVYFGIVGCFLIVTFWYLDSYYLQQERKMREIYNDVAEISESPQKVKPFSFQPNNYSKGKYLLITVMFSRTEWPLYVGFMAAYIVILMAVNKTEVLNV